MLSDEQVRLILKNKSRSDFSPQYIRDFDQQWNEAVEALRNSGADLGKIIIVSEK